MFGLDRALRSNRASSAGHDSPGQEAADADAAVDSSKDGALEMEELFPGRDCQMVAELPAGLGVFAQDTRPAARSANRRRR